MVARILTWEGKKKVIVETDDPEQMPPGRKDYEVLMQWRSQAKLRRNQALSAIRDAGLIPAVQAQTAATVGTLPTLLEAALVDPSNGFTLDQQSAFRVTFASFTEVHRLDPWIEFMGQVYSMSDTEIDDIFRDYA
jgi:hypothetical protein